MPLAHARGVDSGLLMEVIRFAGYQGPGSVHTRAVQVLRAALGQMEAPVELAFTANITEGGRKASDLLAMTEAGEIDACYFSSSYLAARVPELGLFDLPFEVADRARCYAALDGAVGRDLAAAVAGATGFRVLGYWDNGIRQISNGVRPIREPADCRGLKLRTLDNPVHQAAYRALGFEPVAIDVRDLPAAVAEGRVDAQENPLTNIVHFGLYRHHRHVTLTRHVVGVALVLANAERHRSWSPAVRAALDAAMAEASAAQRGFAQAEDRDGLDLLARDGVEPIEISPEARRAFRAAVAPVIDQARSRYDPKVLASLGN
jgi:TRAP-type C4-dicarboxylate transport system substrate-binding protein